jgi:hypothetical protein
MGVRVELDWIEKSTTDNLENSRREGTLIFLRLECMLAYQAITHSTTSYDHRVIYNACSSSFPLHILGAWKQNYLELNFLVQPFWLEALNICIRKYDRSSAPVFGNNSHIIKQWVTSHKATWMFNFKFLSCAEVPWQVMPSSCQLLSAAVKIVTQSRETVQTPPINLRFERGQRRLTAGWHHLSRHFGTRPLINLKLNIQVALWEVTQ